MSRPQPLRHSWPENDGKRTLSPNQIHDGTKRTRSVYLVESPGGTLRQDSPTKVYQPEIEKLRISSLPTRPSPRGNNERPIKEEQRPVKPTVYDLLTMGIRRAVDKELDYKCRMRQILGTDPQLLLKGPLEDSPYVSGMQNAVDRAMHMSHMLAPSQIEADGTRLRSSTDVVLQELIDRRPGQGTSRIRAERRAERKKREEHMKDRYYYLHVVSYIFDEGVANSIAQDLIKQENADRHGPSQLLSLLASPDNALLRTKPCYASRRLFRRHTQSLHYPSSSRAQLRIQEVGARVSCFQGTCRYEVQSVCAGPIRE